MKRLLSLVQVSPTLGALTRGASQFLGHFPFMFAPGNTSPVTSFINAEARQIIIVHHGGVRLQGILTGNPLLPGTLSLSKPIIPTAPLRGINTLKYSPSANLKIGLKGGAILSPSHLLKRGCKPQIGLKDTLGAFLYIKTIMMKASPLLLNSLKSSLSPLLLP